MMMSLVSINDCESESDHVMSCDLDDILFLVDGIA